MSKIRRRGGTAIVAILELLKWQPRTVYQVGVGLNHAEVDVMVDSWPGVTFVGCEPHPETVKAIDKSYPGDLYEVAIGDTRGHTVLHSKRRHRDGSSLYAHNHPREKESYGEIQVNVSTLDDMFYGVDGHTIGEDVLLWLDCEGSELSALRGAARFLKHVKAINIELTSNPPGNWPSAVEIHTLLNDLGFLRQNNPHDTIRLRTMRLCIRETVSV